AASSTPVPFGQPVILTATVTPVTPGVGAPAGTVQFKRATVNLGAAVPLVGGKASITIGSLLPNQTITAVYSGDANFLTSQRPLTPTVTFSHAVVTGIHGAMTLSGGSWLLSAATVQGNLTIAKGTIVAIVSSHITGTLTQNTLSTDTGGALSLCGTSVGGNVKVSRATGAVLIGDNGDDGCGIDTLSMGLALASNTGGVEMAGNKITGSV